MKEKKVLVIGAGLAGVEASLFLARRGVQVVLCESKRIKKNPAQKMDTFAELVCTNSLKSVKEESGHGLLKLEMQAFDSVVLEEGFRHQVPAGDALAVDRHQFSLAITKRLEEHPLIQVVDEEVVDPLDAMRRLGADMVIVASGPLTTDSLSKWIQENISQEDFYFYDAIAPVVDADTLDYSKLYWKDRHSKDPEKADYLNAPFNEEEYQNFIRELQLAEKVPPREFESYTYFESCLPIDVMAERGSETARFSCMKPIGLEVEGMERPHAVVQLRKENLLGHAFNLVGLQTRLTYKEQLRVFRMIPGLANASFVHLGSVHRNSFLNARRVLDWDMSSKRFSELYFAGQISGVEGYTESAAMGLYVAYQVWRKLQNLSPLRFPVETALGALVNYLMTQDKPTPSNINFGLFPTMEVSREEKREEKKLGKNVKLLRKKKIVARAKEVFSQLWQNEIRGL